MICFLLRVPFFAYSRKRSRRLRGNTSISKRKGSVRQSSQKKSFLEMPGPEATKTSDVAEVIELSEETERKDEQYYENTAFIGIYFLAIAIGDRQH